MTVKCDQDPTPGNNLICFLLVDQLQVMDATDFLLPMIRAPEETIRLQEQALILTWREYIGR